MKTSKYLFIITILILTKSNTSFARTAPWIGVDFNGTPCNGADPTRWYGPYDYTIPEQKARLRIVNEHHFTPNVENHIRGQEGSILSDINYTLMAGPNHHPALLSLIRFKSKLDKKIIKLDVDEKKIDPPVECYFKRAINFSPNDAATYALYAYYLKEIKKTDEAKRFYEKALLIQPKSAKIAYSYSLLLLETKDYDKAVEYAKRAYQDNQTPSGLKDKLISLGKWTEQANLK